MKTIVCYGDSNTYGYNPENGFRYEYEERWTTILQKELKDSAIVIPEGLNGRTTSFEDELRPGRNGATYLDPCLHSHGPIDLVVLMLGTNDLKIRFQATPTDIGKRDRPSDQDDQIDHSTEETRWTIRKDPFNGTTASGG